MWYFHNDDIIAKVTKKNAHFSCIWNQEKRQRTPYAHVLCICPVNVLKYSHKMWTTGDFLSAFDQLNILCAIIRPTKNIEKDTKCKIMVEVREMKYIPDDTTNKILDL